MIVNVRMYVIYTWPMCILHSYRQRIYDIQIQKKNDLLVLFIKKIMSMHFFYYRYLHVRSFCLNCRARRGGMVVGFITTHVINAYQ